MNRRKFLKLLGLAPVGLMIPGKLIAKIPIPKEAITVIKSKGPTEFNLMWEAQQDWGILESFAIFDGHKMIYTGDFDRSQKVQNGDTINVSFILDSPLSDKYSIGLYNNTEEVSGDGYSRRKVKNENNNN